MNTLTLEGAVIPRTYSAPDDDTQEIECPIVTRPEDDYDDDRRRAWLTYRQHELYDAIQDRYPHAELADGPAVRIGGITRRQFIRDTFDDHDIPAGKLVWGSALSPIPYVIVDLQHIEE
jgi:hypothetical protein